MRPQTIGTHTVFAWYHPISAEKICPLASINASTDNEVKRLFLSIAVQKSDSAESYTPKILYRLAPYADSLKQKSKVFFCLNVFYGYC